MRRVALLLSLLASTAWADPFVDMAVEQPAAPVLAADFTLPNLQGESLPLESLRGKLVLLNFWATWCAPCRAEMPGMAQLWQEYRDQGFEIVAISVDEGNEKRVANFVRRLNLSYPVVLDPESVIADRYGVGGLPASFLIDGEGLLIGRLVGSREWGGPQARALIGGLLSR
jgi:peroxiredoxin